jgi:phosphatidylglycerol:prolipoprotein diacylglycerol transferase
MLFHDTTAFQIGNLAVKWYGLFIMLGVIAAALLAYRLAPLKGEDPEHIWGLLPWVVVFGILAARITYGLVRYDTFNNPIEWFTKFRQGGIAIQGAVAGGLLAGWVYCRVKGLIFLRWADIIAPGLSLAQGIGRWGNYANQEEFGGPTTLPWGIKISPDRLEAKGLPVDVHVHPAFLYESIADITIALVLVYCFTRLMVPQRWRDGDIFGLYAILYGITRFFTESIRIDRAMIGPLPGAYWASGLFILAGLGLILWNRTRPAPDYRLPSPPSDLETTGAAVPAAAAAVAMNTREAGLTRMGTGYRRRPRAESATPPTANVRFSDDDDDEGEALT